MADPSEWQSQSRQVANAGKRRIPASGNTQQLASAGKWQTLASGNQQNGKSQQAARPVKCGQVGNPGKHQIIAKLGKWQILAEAETGIRT